MTSGVTVAVLETLHGREENAFHGDEISLLVINMSLTPKKILLCQIEHT